MIDQQRISEILDFWFGAPESPELGQFRPKWFESTPEFDEEIRRRFFADYERAAAGALEEWKQEARGCLALILLLDQFSRNLFREDARAFATDPEAAAIAAYAVERGYDNEVPAFQRMFFYLPFEHSEDKDVQRRSVELFQALAEDAGSDSGLEYAIRHQRVIERFGRFPHRNAVLGRVNTPAESEFLASPEAPF
ncbi:MAG TPA: DUF924 family protein [Armatimonadota bacterium]|nr:DUF924 family protein [Armatimonadota bacterium]